jgi:hypothetical protein
MIETASPANWDQIFTNRQCVRDNGDTGVLWRSAQIISNSTSAPVLGAGPVQFQ